MQSFESEESDPDVRDQIIFNSFDLLNTIILNYSYYLIFDSGVVGVQAKNYGSHQSKLFILLLKG